MRRKRLRNIWTTTNEDLEAIVEGLRVTKDDVILAICGSGDQAFALLEKAKRVIAVDASPEQIVYAQRRAQTLREKGYLPMASDMYPRNKDYMKPRIRRIRENVGNIEFCRVLDIFEDMPQFQGITKLYLSNALFDRNVLSECELISQTLPQNGLVYFTNGQDLFYMDCGLHQAGKFGLVLDLPLTKRIEKYEEFYRPAVYRKIKYRRVA